MRYVKQVRAFFAALFTGKKHSAGEGGRYRYAHSTTMHYCVNAIRLRIIEGKYFEGGDKEMAQKAYEDLREQYEYQLDRGIVGEPAFDDFYREKLGIKKAAV